MARLFVDRSTNHEIAAELFLSQKTRRTYRNIFNKMGVTTRVALAQPSNGRTEQGARPR